MDNETTKILNAPQNSENEYTAYEEIVEKEKKESAMGTRVAVSAVGGALGTAAVSAAEHIYSAATEEPEEEPKMEDDSTENVEVSSARTSSQEAKPEAQPQPEKVVEEPEIRVEESTEEVEPMATDAQYVDNTTQPQSVDADNEVHVVGVALQDNGQGGTATLAALQQGNDAAIVVDVDSDGSIDLIAVDANHDGQYTYNEIHDVSSQNVSTADVVGAYVNEAHAHHEMATVTNLDTNEQYQITEVDGGYGLASIDQTASEPNPDLYTAYSEDMPDYMNDADTGIMEA